MIEKQNRHVNILCQDGVFINAFISVLGEMRTFDILNHSAEKFLLLADVEIMQKENLQDLQAKEMLNLQDIWREKILFVQAICFQENKF